MSDMNAGNGGVSGLGIANAVLGGLQGVGNFISDIATRRQQERLQREAWAREDNAVQRRAADLEAAGLSKTLAAGAAASSQAPVRLDAPHMNIDPVDKYLKAKAQEMQMESAQLGFAQQRADIARTDAQTEYIIQQKENLKQDYEFQFADDPEKLKERRLKNYFADATVETRIESLKSKLTTEQIRQENIMMDTKLKNSGIELNDVRKITEAAWGAYAAAKTGREIQEGVWKQNDRNKFYAEGGEYEMQLDKQAVELQIKQRLWDNMNKKGYEWKGLGKGIDDLMNFVF